MKPEISPRTRTRPKDVSIVRFRDMDSSVTLSAAAIALGTALGGWKLIRTLGGRFYKIRPIHSFSTQMTSGAVILGASYLGLPVSTSQVVSSAIMGVGSAERISKVRWSVAEEIITSWLFTIPASGLIAAGVYWLIVNFIN